MFVLDNMTRRNHMSRVHAWSSLAGGLFRKCLECPLAACRLLCGLLLHHLLNLPRVA
jgi:hypothetical protein